jgi:hypothetical protein
VRALGELPEPVQENIEKAFAILNLAPGLRLAKLNEFLLAAEGMPEERAKKLLEWLRDEFAKRQGRERGQKKATDNGKTSAPPIGTAAQPPPAETAVAAPAAAVPAPTTPAPTADEVFGKTSTVAPDAALGF